MKFAVCVDLDSDYDASESNIQVPELPVPQLLSSMVVPSEADEAAIRQYIEALNEQKEAISTAILKQMTVIRAHVFQQIAIDKAITQAQGILHPLRSLTPEILSEIFLHCDFNGMSKRYPYVPYSFHPLRGPLLVAQVSRWWRAVAIGTPGLWTTLRVRVKPGQPSELKESQLSLLSAWFTRSGTLPLVFCVRVKGSVVSFQDPVIQGLLSQSERCKEFYWIFDDYFLVSSILLSLYQHTAIFPSLDNYSFISRCNEDVSVQFLHLPAGYGPITTPPVSRYFDTLPHLKNVRLHAGYDFRHLDLPFERMVSLELYTDGTRLTTTSLTIEACLQVLTLCPLLERFCVCCHPDRSGSQDLAAHTPFVEHSRLRTFHLLVLPDFGTIIRLLQTLRLPKIEDIKLHCSTEFYPAWDTKTLPQFISGIKTSVRVLQIFGIGSLCVFWSREFEAVLGQCTNLASLRLESSNLSDQFLDSFSDGSSTKPYLPCLVYLELDGTMKFSPGAFSKFLRAAFQRKESPSEGVTSLQSLIMRCRGVTPEFINSEVFQELLIYKEEGRCIKIDTEYANLFPRASLLSRRFPEHPALR